MSSSPKSVEQLESKDIFRKWQKMNALPQNSNLPKAKMGIGLVMPGDVKVFPHGHMWIWWQETGTPCEFRGYYPVRADVPSSILDSDNRIKALRFYASAEESVRGFYQEDLDAEDLMGESLDLVFQKTWEIEHVQLERLKDRCNFTEGKSLKLEGYYSWNRKHFKSENCSAWVLKVLYHVLRDPIFWECRSPKQLSIVKEFIDKRIKWDHVPDKYKEKIRRQNK